MDGDPKVADHPYRTAVRVDGAGRRCFLVLLAFGVAMQAWALFPSTVESESYVPLPEATAPTAAEVNSARAAVVGNPLEFSRADAFTLMAAKLVSSNPTSYGLAAVGYSSPVVDLSPAPLKAKLWMLLIQLSSMSGDMDLSALVAKLRALLELPDSALVAVLGLPEMADLNAMLDATSLGKVDLPGITKEMGKIELRSAPETPYQVEVAVNGKPTVTGGYALRAERLCCGGGIGSSRSARGGGSRICHGRGRRIRLASAVTPSVLRAAAPPPETFAPEAPAQLMAMVAPETFAPETPAPMMATFAPETFAPETFAPETFAPETFAPETFAPAP